MKHNAKIAPPILAALALFILILDTKTAITGAQEALEICYRTLIPTLFPFFVVSGLFCHVYSKLKLRCLKPVMRLCGLPDGSEAIFLIGMLGGYPVGAKTIADAYKSGTLDKANGQRMLGFCSNTGPSFIFGIIGMQFSNPNVSWVLMTISILSAIITGWVLPRNTCSNINPHDNNRLNYALLIENSIRAIATVCSWIILFRVILSFANRWFLWMLPIELQVVVTGILDLSNGCINLTQISNEGLRLIVAAGILSFGGLCVYLQTISVTKDLGIGMYFLGKVLQLFISIIMSAFIQSICFDSGNNIPLTRLLIPMLLLISFVVILKVRNNKITVAFCGKRVYNIRNQC